MGEEQLGRRIPLGSEKWDEVVPVQECVDEGDLEVVAGSRKRKREEEEVEEVSSTLVLPLAAGDDDRRYWLRSTMVASVDEVYEIGWTGMVMGHSR